MSDIEREWAQLIRHELAASVIRQQRHLEPTYGISPETIVAYHTACAQWFERQAAVKGSNP